MTIQVKELVKDTVVPAKALELAGKHLGLTVGQISLTRLAGDASSRAYFRAQPDDSANERLARSIIVAVYPAAFDMKDTAAARLARSEMADPALRLTFANDPCAHLEVTQLFLDAGLPVPRILDVVGGDGVMLIEEVGDSKLQDWLASTSPEEKAEAYRRAVDLIVRIQELTPRVLSSDSICSRLAFDEAKLKWELDFFFKNYFERHLAIDIGAEKKQAIDEEFIDLCRELAALPRVLVHRDYHARNLMMRDGKMFIIDHQDARLGPETYDLVSLIADPYAGVSHDLAIELADYFVERKSISALPLSSINEFRIGLDLATIQRMLKAVGTYSSQAVLRENPVYLPYIAPAVSSALEPMRRLRRFNRLRQLLEDTLQSA